VPSGPITALTPLVAEMSTGHGPDPRHRELLVGHRRAAEGGVVGGDGEDLRPPGDGLAGGGVERHLEADGHAQLDQIGRAHV